MQVKICSWQVMSQKLDNYIEEGWEDEASDSRSLQKLMDILSGLRSTMELLKSTSEALIKMADDAEWVS